MHEALKRTSSTDVLFDGIVLERILKKRDSLKFQSKRHNMTSFAIKVKITKMALAPRKSLCEILGNDPSSQLPGAN